MPLSMQAGTHSKGSCKDAVCHSWGFKLPGSADAPAIALRHARLHHSPSVHTRHVHTQELCMEPVTGAATVTGGPQPDPLLPLPDPHGPRSTGSSRSAALPGVGPLSATGETPGRPTSSAGHFKQPLKKGFPSSCLPQEQMRSLPLSTCSF